MKGGLPAPHLGRQGRQQAQHLCCCRIHAIRDGRRMLADSCAAGSAGAAQGGGRHLAHGAGRAAAVPLLQRLAPGAPCRVRGARQPPRQGRARLHRHRCDRCQVCSHRGTQPMRPQHALVGSCRCCSLMGHIARQNKIWLTAKHLAQNVNIAQVLNTNLKRNGRMLKFLCNGN